MFNFSIFLKNSKQPFILSITISITIWCMVRVRLPY